MSDVILIVLARAIHVMAGVTWAGASFVLAAVLMPLTARHAAEGAGRWLGLAARRAGMFSGISALLTVASGIYLFAVLHPHDDSANGLVLKAGAVAALLSMVLGLLVGRPAGMRIAQLQAASTDGTAPSADVLARLAALRRRATLTAQVNAGLLVLAVVAMAVFRYASALG